MSSVTSSQEVLGEAALRFSVYAAFPRLYRWLEPASRLGPRSLAIFVAVNTALVYTTRFCLVPRLQRFSEELELAKAQLRRTLGREPTDEELIEHRRRAAEQRA